MTDQPTKKGTPIWLSLGIGVGTVLLVSCCCAGGVGGWVYYKLTTSPNVVGRWQHPWGNKDIYEFRADGAGHIESKDFGVLPFRYRFVSTFNMEITFQPGKLKLDDMHVQVVLLGDEMRLDNLKDGAVGPTLKRIR
jgi:hypothetical protein